MQLRKIILPLVGVLCIATIASAATPIATTQPAIFAAAFTNITDTSARCVFTTTIPSATTVSVLSGDHVVKKIVEPQALEIHHVQFDELEPHATYKVTVEADGIAPVSLPLVTGQRAPRFNHFEGKTYFGVAHADDMEPLKKLGAGLLRYSASWDVLEPRAGQINPKALQKMVDDVSNLKAAGVEPLVLLCYSTRWAKQFTNRQNTWRNAAFGPPDSVDDWRTYVKTVMTAMKEKVRYYEVWNEPDAGYLVNGVAVEKMDPTIPPAIRDLYRSNHDYWIGDRYVPLAMAAREVADEVDGDRIDIVGPAWNRDHFATDGGLCFERGLYAYLQTYSFHNYVSDPNSYVRWEQSTNDQFITNANALFKKYDVSMPIAVTEWGVQTYANPKPGTGFHTYRDGQIFIVKSVFDYLSTQQISMLVLHQLEYNDPWSLVDKSPDGVLTYHPTFDTYHWLCTTFNEKAYSRLNLKTDAPATTRAFAIRLNDSRDTYIAIWQNFGLQGDAVTPVPEQAAKCALNGLPNGNYTMQKLDLSGQVVSSNPIQVNGDFIWTDTIPPAGALAESEPVVYRLTPR